MTAIYSVPFCKLLKIKLVNGMVVDTPVRQNILNKYWLRAKLTFPFSNIIVGNSKAGLKAYGAPLRKSLCIYNGMDLTRFERIKEVSIVKEELIGNKSSNAFIIGMVAAFEERKDYKTLINAAIALTSINNNVFFILVGAGITLNNLKNKVPQTVKDKILFLGKRSDVESIVNIFDIGILLTNSKLHGEGISNSIIEYMALGKPVIATCGGGTDEVIIDGHNGFLLDSGNAKSLLDKIEILMQNSTLRANLGENGKQMVIDKFDIRIMTNQYITLYKRLLSK